MKTRRIGRWKLKVLVALAIVAFAGMPLCRTAFAEAIADYMEREAAMADLEAQYEGDPTSAVALADFYADNIQGIGEAADVKEGITPEEFVGASGEKIDMDVFGQAVEENAPTVEEATETVAHEEEGAAPSEESAGESAAEATSTGDDTAVVEEAPVVEETLIELATEVANDANADQVNEDVVAGCPEGQSLVDGICG